MVLREQVKELFNRKYGDENQALICALNRKCGFGLAGGNCAQLFR